jgi:hypothetical protein
MDAVSFGGLLGPEFVGKIWHCAIVSANERPHDMGAKPLNTTANTGFIYFLFRYHIVTAGISDLMTTIAAADRHQYGEPDRIFLTAEGQEATGDKADEQGYQQRQID